METAECGKGRIGFVLELDRMSRPFPIMMFRPESTKVAYMRLIEELDKLGPFVIEEKNNPTDTNMHPINAMPR